MHLKQIALLACFTLGTGTANAMPFGPTSPNSDPRKVFDQRQLQAKLQKMLQQQGGKKDRKKGRQSAMFKSKDNKRNTG